MPIINSIILAIGFAVGNVLRIPLPLTGVFISALDICVICVYILCIFAQKNQLQNLNKKNKNYILAVLLFVLIAIASLLINGREFGLQAQTIGVLYIVRWVLYAGLPIVLPRNMPVSPIATAIVLPSLLQYIFIPDIRFLADQNWDPHFYRVVGTLLDPGFTGLLLIFLLAWVFAQKSQKIWTVLIGIGAYSALALTYSRSSYIAFIAMIGYISYRKKSTKFFLKILALCVVTVIALPHPGGEGVKLERTSTIFARIQNWSNTIMIASDYPFIGTGFNTYRFAQKKYGLLTEANWQENHAGSGADSSLLFVLATTGVVGLIVYTKYLSSIKKTEHGMLYLTPLLVHSWFLNSLFFPAVLVLFAVLISKSMGGIGPKSLSD